MHYVQFASNKTESGWQTLWNEAGPLMHTAKQAIRKAKRMHADTGLPCRVLFGPHRDDVLYSVGIH